MNPTDDAGGDRPSAPVSDLPIVADRQSQSGFDYDALPSNRANELAERATRIQDAVKKATATAIAIGRELIAAKKSLGHGRFLEWVESECSFSVRTSQHYMAITRISTKYAFVAYLPITVVLRLARTRGRFEFLEKIAVNIGPEGRPNENDIVDLLEKFKKKRRANPPCRHAARPDRLNPVERPSQQCWGYTKTQYGMLNAQYMLRHGGFLCLHLFRDIVRSDTVSETLRFVEQEIKRLEYEKGIADMRIAWNQK